MKFDCYKITKAFIGIVSAGGPFFLKYFLCRFFVTKQCNLVSIADSLGALNFIKNRRKTFAKHEKNKKNPNKSKKRFENDQRKKKAENSKPSRKNIKDQNLQDGSQNKNKPQTKKKGKSNCSKYGDFLKKKRPKCISKLRKRRSDDSNFFISHNITDQSKYLANLNALDRSFFSNNTESKNNAKISFNNKDANITGLNSSYEIYKNLSYGNKKIDSFYATNTRSLYKPTSESKFLEALRKKINDNHDKESPLIRTDSNQNSENNENDHFFNFNTESKNGEDFQVVRDFLRTFCEPLYASLCEKSEEYILNKYQALLYKNQSTSNIQTNPTLLID